MVEWYKCMNNTRGIKCQNFAKRLLSHGQNFTMVQSVIWCRIRNSSPLNSINFITVHPFSLAIINPLSLQQK
jgi:hypothetical protein